MRREEGGARDPAATRFAIPDGVHLGGGIVPGRVGRAEGERAWARARLSILHNFPK